MKHFRLLGLFVPALIIPYAVGCDSSPANVGGGGSGGGTHTSSGSTSSSSSGSPSTSSGTSASSGGASSSGATTSRSSSSTSSGSSSGATSSSTSGSSSGSAALPALHVTGAQILDANNQVVVLRGISLIDIGQLYHSANDSISGVTDRIDQVLTTLGMKAKVIRLPVYPRTCTNPGYPTYSPLPYPVGAAPPATSTVTQVAISASDYISKILKPTVDYLASKGVYAIIDYHQIDNAVGARSTEAVEFWTTVAPVFANYTNVLYEPFNEPIDTTTAAATFAQTAQQWVTTIRTGAPNNVIIVGNQTWCQKPNDLIASNGVTGSNLVYTAHIYPGNWPGKTNAFPTQVSTAIAKAPIFITEWGYQTTGTGNLSAQDSWGTDLQTTLNGDGASWTAWVADASWGPPMFSKTTSSGLTSFGSLVKTWLNSY